MERLSLAVKPAKLVLITENLEGWKFACRRNPLFTLEKGDDANYLIIGLEDATLPLDTETNAVRYWFMQN